MEADTDDAVILLAALVLCFATVPLAGGSLTRLSELRFERAVAGISALVIQYLIIRAFPSGETALLQGLHLVTYALLFYFLAGNLSLPGLWLIGLGGALNAMAISANDGVMPAHPDALAVAGIAVNPTEFANSTAVVDPKLWILGDIFALPAGWPLANVFSLGDILIVAGAFTMLHRQSRSVLEPAFAYVASRARRAIPQLDLVREHRAFRRLWVAQGISAVGDWVYPLAVFSYVIDDETKAASLSFLLIAQFGPGLLVGIFGGPVIDRFSRKTIMLTADLVRGGAIVSLLLAGEPALVHLYAVAVVIGVGAAFNVPAFQASLPNILPIGRLAAANALVGLTLSFAVTVGPVLGAVIVTEFGIDWGFTANAVSFLFSAALVYGTDMPRRVAPAKMVFGRDLLDGMRFVAGHRVVLSVVLVVGIITLGAGIKAPLEPLYAIGALEAGTSGLGWLGGVWGIGMLVGALLASRLDARFGHGPLLTLSILTVGVAVALGAYSPSLAPVLVLWAIAGIANTTGTVAYETLLQERTPDRVRGRVFAAVEASLQAGQLAGVALAAFSEQIFGDEMAARHGIFAAGLLFALAAAISARLLRERRAGRGQPFAWTGRATLEPDPPTLAGMEVVPSGGSLALLRVATTTAPDSAPVLVVDDGVEVLRFDALPGHNGSSFGYGVQRELLRSARLALELPRAGRLDLPTPQA